MTGCSLRRGKRSELEWGMWVRVAMILGLRLAKAIPVAPGQEIRG